ncbi:MULTISPECIES: translation initiation factor 2 [Methylobacterium]|uniref:translation initiation factor 2 n=1 Tax=Methylobacterium TaxID=407 RepID=UPI0013EBE464|nr:translation initiation factor 2 [Methylobacterium sp. DB0501]NGM35326.1 translation initiation factor 2 [Methylobacterium sp. DB0501]
MSIKTISAAALMAVGLGACGSIVRGTTEQVSFVSVPSGAAMTTDKKYACPITPCTLEVDRSDEFVATFTKPGYHPESIPVRTKVAGRGAASVAGNVLAGGLIGVGVDAYTGAALDHEPNPVIATMRPAGNPGPRRRGPAPNQPGM